MTDLTNEQARAVARADDLYEGRMTAYLLENGTLIIAADAWNALEEKYESAVLVYEQDAVRQRLETDAQAAAHWLEDARTRGRRI